MVGKMNCSSTAGGGCNGELVECKLRSEKTISVSVKDAAVGESMWAAFFIRSRLMLLGFPFSSSEKRFS